MGARATPFAQPTMKLIIVALVLSAAIVAALPARFGEADPDAIVPEDSFESTVDSILMQGPAKAAPRGGKNGKADDHKPNGKKDDHKPKGKGSDVLPKHGDHKPTGKGSEKKADGAASNHAHKKPHHTVLVASKHAAKGAQGHGSDHKPNAAASNHKPPITNHHPHTGDHTVLVASKHAAKGAQGHGSDHKPNAANANHKSTGN